MSLLWWGYLHVDGNIQVKRYFGDWSDILKDVEYSDFVVGVFEPFEAESREEAVRIIMSREVKLKMKAVIRCTRVAERPDYEQIKQFDPEIEQCENCEEDIWVSSISRSVRAESGRANTVMLCKTLCKECVLEEESE